jgi:peptide/nickel transport system substrate-binding protein
MITNNNIKEEKMIKKWEFLKVFVMLIFIVLLSFPFTLQAKAQTGKPVVLKLWFINWPDLIEIGRLLSEDLEKLGIQTNIRTGTVHEWVGEIIKRKNPNHLVMDNWGAGPDRLEPSFFLIEFFHSDRAKPGGRNYGYYQNSEYDKIMDSQLRELNIKKRQALIWEAQEIIARDNAIFPIFHKDYIQAYNSERIEGVVPCMGNPVGFPYTYWTFLEAKPKKDITEPRLVKIQDIVTLNPFAVSNVINEGWLRLAYTTFLTRGKKTELVPWAAESWEIIDDTNVDIVLRKGMKFHDGKPVTVEDVKFTFDYIKKWKFPPLSAVWETVETVTVMDDQRVRFKLFKPYAPFAANVLMHAFIAPKHIWEKIPESVGVKNPADWPNPKPIGSGPYQFIEWKKGEYFHLKANKEHWAAPNFDGLYCIVTPSLEGMMAALERGDAEILGWFVDAKQGKKLDSNPHLKMVTAPGHGLYEMRPNFRMKPTSDPIFRKAFQHAINRKKMLDVIFEGHGTICHNTPITPLVEFWSNPNIGTPEFDLTKARKILKDGGYTWDSEGHLCYP